MGNKNNNMDGNNDNKGDANMRLAWRLAGLVTPLRGKMALAVSIGTLGHLCTIFIPVFGGYVLLDALGVATPFPLRAGLVCIGAFAALRSVFRYLEQRLNHDIAFRLLALIRDKVFSALRTLAPAKLEGKDKGNLISVITTDIELLEVFFAHTISPVLISIVVSAAMCVFLGMLHPLLALVAACAYLCVGLLLPKIASAGNSAAGQAYRRDFGELNSYLFDSLRGVDQSIQYGAGAERLDRLNEMTENLSRRQKQLKSKEAKGLGLKNAAILLFSALMLATGMGLYGRGLLGAGAALLSVIAMLGSFAPVSAVADLSSGLVQTFASARRVFRLLDETPAVAEVKGGADVAFSGMRCENVSFAYGEEAVLRDFSLSVEQNKIIGVTGRSGSGKSTLLKLLMRFWDADAGAVTMSGVDVRGVNTDCLRGLQSYMTQETQLFNDTLLGNLRVAKPDATAAEVEAACRKAAIHDFIAGLPEGYETQAGELGERLSSGERQRIGLARAFLHDAPLILLDEPTSNLDSLNEAAILRSLCEGGGDKTVVLVSHRKSTMRVAGKTYSVADGRVS
jgi:ATP-binding cassette subfamily C protein